MISDETGKAWGAHFIGDGRVRFRLWAPGESSLSLRLGDRDVPMRAGEDGWFEIEMEDVRPGQAYEYVLGDGTSVPDPAARGLAGDVHGPSLVLDPLSYRWKHAEWRGRPWHEAIIYELHIGTFTPEGTFSAAAERLSHLAAIGVTAIEIMPVAQFGGARGWGYDGVFHYAPHNAYGTADEMKALIDEAHGLGLMVFLDVVYNHFGPEGNALPRYASKFFHQEKETPWGAAIAFEKKPVRNYFIDNALYWIGEFHLDGLRFDAIDQILDEGGDPHVIVEIASRIRARFADRHVHLITEDPRNLTGLRHQPGPGKERLYDGDWNDDYHHAAHVLATGETKGYYSDFAEDPLEKFALALAKGYVFPGKPPAGEAHPAPCLPSLVSFLQNHDQAGNRAFGDRLISLIPADMLKALMTITMLSPHMPMLFMGEEFGETRPFCFFTDYTGDLARAVREGRRGEANNFGGMPTGRTEKDLPDPNAPETFAQSKLDWEKTESPEGRGWTGFMRDLIRTRQRFIIPLLAGAREGETEGRVMVAERGLLAVDWRVKGGARLHLRANLGETTARILPVEGDIVHAEPEGAKGVFAEKGDLAAKSVIFALSAM